MSSPSHAADTPITVRDQLIQSLAKGEKPRADWRIGTEHEKFGFRRADLRPPPYEPDGIRAVLDAMAGPEWEPILDRGRVIGLKGQGAHRGASVSLEPAGQFELSGGMLQTLHETRDELAAHFEAVRRAAGPLGLGFASMLLS